MFFLRRRRVFIGECDGQAVYYDQKTGEALAAPKSVLVLIRPMLTFLKWLFF